METPGAESNATRIFVLLFLSLNFLFLIMSSGRVRTRDELSVDLQAESLATRGSTATPQAPPFFFTEKSIAPGNRSRLMGPLTQCLCCPGMKLGEFYVPFPVFPFRPKMWSWMRPWWRAARHFQRWQWH